MKRFLCGLVALLIGFGLSAPPAQATYTVTLTEVGSNVVATGSGTIDLTGLMKHGNGGESPGVFPSTGIIFTCPSVISDAYTGFTGPTNFGTSAGTFADSGSGDFVGIFPGLGDLFVPEGYTSGTHLKDTSTYKNQTITSLGVTPGTYRWTWGADSFVLIINPPGNNQGNDNGQGNQNP
jgi:hypothetical protein